MSLSTTSFDNFNANDTATQDTLRRELQNIMQAYVTHTNEGEALVDVAYDVAEIARPEGCTEQPRAPALSSAPAQ